MDTHSAIVITVEDSSHLHIFFSIKFEYFWVLSEQGHTFIQLNFEFMIVFMEVKNVFKIHSTFQSYIKQRVQDTSVAHKRFLHDIQVE